MLKQGAVVLLKNPDWDLKRGRLRNGSAALTDRRWVIWLAGLNPSPPCSGNMPFPRAERKTASSTASPAPGGVRVGADKNPPINQL